MYTVGTRLFYRELFRLSFAVFAVVSFLLRPVVAAQGVLQGLALCYESVIPALFPFFVLSKIILSSPFACVLSVPLLPYTRYVLGIKDSRAATALLLGLTGGFGGGASCLQTLHLSGALTKTDSTRLLWCLINAGPAFVVAGVGTAMLGSTAAGWLLYAALCLASLCSGAFCRMHLGRTASARQTIASNTVVANGAFCRSVTTTAQRNEAATLPAFTPLASAVPQRLVDCVREAVFSVLTLCGFVLFFSFFLAVLVPPTAHNSIRFLFSLPFEVTAACSLAAVCSAYPIYACCGALSFMGASVFLQVRALIPAEIPLHTLLLSRIVHVPASLLMLWLLLQIFPFPLAAAAQPLLRMRMPVDACCIVFLLCCTFFCSTAQNSPLRFLQKRV